MNTNSTEIPTVLFNAKINKNDLFRRYLDLQQIPNKNILNFYI